MKERKKISFGFNLGDENIKLIDILSEDDDFLVASLRDGFSDNATDYGGFRLSGFGDSQELKIIQQKEQNVQTSDPFGQPRPSYLRRSLAWDNAFFDSAGVLDPDELSFINEGFRTNEAHLLPGVRDVHKIRSESDSSTNVDGDSLNWFEIEPFEYRGESIYTSNCSKVDGVVNRSSESGLELEGLQYVQDLRKINKSVLHKMKSNQTSSGKSINIQNEEKTKNETTSRRKQRTISSPKPPKASGRTKNISTHSNNRNLSATFDVKMENKSTTIGTGKDMLMEKKTGSLVSPRAIKASTACAPFIDTSIGASSLFLKRRTESRMSKVSSSLSASKIWRHSEMRNGMVSCPSYASYTCHLSSGSLSSSVSDKQRSNGSKINLDTKKTLRGTFLHSDAKEASDLQSSLQSPLSSSQATAGICSVRSLATKDFRPSGLRPPSPRIRFFDEVEFGMQITPSECHGASRSRKMPQKVSSAGTSFSELLPDSSISSGHASAGKKLKSPFPEVAMNIKRSKTDHVNTFCRRDKEMYWENERVGDQENEKRSPPCPGDQLGNLSKHFEAIDLNQEHKLIDRQSKRNKNSVENQLPDSPMASSKLHQHSPPPLAAAASISGTRTPLADKNICSQL